MKLFKKRIKCNICGRKCGKDGICYNKEDCPDYLVYQGGDF